MDTSFVISDENPLFVDDFTDGVLAFSHGLDSLPHADHASLEVDVVGAVEFWEVLEGEVLI